MFNVVCLERREDKGREKNIMFGGRSHLELDPAASQSVHRQKETNITVINPYSRHDNGINLPTASRQNHINNAEDTAPPDGYGHD